jgi:hypothetical protein
MTDKPLPEDEPGAEERFDRAIKNALATPPKPRVASGKVKAPGSQDPKSQVKPR